MQSLLLDFSVWRWRVIALLALGLAMLPTLAARATPATMAGLLRNVERDVGAMTEQVSVMRRQLGQQADGEAPASSIVGIADGSFLSTLRSLHQAAIRLERRLGDLRPRLRQIDEAGAGDVLLAMRVELSALTLALGELAASEDAATRAAALDQLGGSLAALDGATAAVWTLGGAEDLPTPVAAPSAGALPPANAADDRL